jgi:ribose transport system ATP-binding protein
LLDFVRRFVGKGGSCILISHLLGEVLGNADRIVVMRDGKIVAADRADAYDRDKLVATMGGAAAREKISAERKAGQREIGAVRVQARPRRQRDDMQLVARAGEIIGLAGLAGNGQTDLLLAIFDAAGSRRSGIEVTAPLALVAGDRQSDGIFPQWSIAQNIGIRSIERMVSGMLISSRQEAELASHWQQRIKIRTPDMDNNILSLSGGNQQKALFARALGTRAPVVLMDDPMRGVDVGTKQEVHARLRAEADQGRTFVWYSTEMEEICLCDRIYVFRNGSIVAELGGAEIAEHAILAASFKGAAA